MPSRSDGEKTRQKILTHSIRLFAKDGFDRVSFQQIADKCGLSQSAVMHHFRKRDDLIEAVVQTVLQHNRAVVEPELWPDAGALTQLRKIFRINLKWVIQYKEDAQILLLLYYYASRDPRFSKFYLKLRTFARQRVCGLIADGIKEGQFRAPLGAEATAEILQEFTIGALVNLVCVTNIEQPSISSAEKKWDALIDSLLIRV